MTEQVPWSADPATGLSWSDRFRGAMLGGAVGDALGAGVRKFNTARLRQWFGSRGVVDYLPVFGRRGAATELTQLTTFTLEALLRAKAADPEAAYNCPPTDAVRANHLRWLHTQGVPWEFAMWGYLGTDPAPSGWLLERGELFSTRNPSGPTLFGLGELAGVTPDAGPYAPVPLGGRCVSEAVVWAAPTMVWGNRDEIAFVAGWGVGQLLTSDSNLHGANGLHADVLAQMIRGVSLWDAVSASEAHRLDTFCYNGHPVEVHRTVHAAMFAAQHGRRPTPEMLDTEFDTDGKPGELGIALASVATADNFVDAVLSAVNQSADSSVTGALAGQLAGALHGPGAIPPRWLEELELREVIETLCADATEAFAPPPPPPPLPRWAQRYVADSANTFSGPLELEPRQPETSDAVDTEPHPVVSERIAPDVEENGPAVAAENAFAPEQSRPGWTPESGDQDASITQVLPVIDAVVPGEESSTPGEPNLPAREPSTPDRSEYSDAEPPMPRSLRREQWTSELDAEDTTLSGHESPATELPPPGSVEPEPVVFEQEEPEWAFAQADSTLPESEREASGREESGSEGLGWGGSGRVEPEREELDRVELDQVEPEREEPGRVEPDRVELAREEPGRPEHDFPVLDLSEPRQQESESFEGRFSEAEAPPAGSPAEGLPTGPSAEGPAPGEPTTGEYTVDDYAVEESVTADLGADRKSGPESEPEPLSRPRIQLPVPEPEEPPEPEPPEPEPRPSGPLDLELLDSEPSQAEPSQAEPPRAELSEAESDPRPAPDSTAVPPDDTSARQQPAPYGGHPEPAAAPPAPQHAGGGHAAVEDVDAVAPSLTERILGSFLGGALGDALGSDLEFATAEQIGETFGPHGPTGLREAYGVHGAITDDTQMTLFTAEGLVRGSVACRMLGRQDPLPEVQLAYQRWLHTQGVEWESAAGPFLADHSEPDGWLICVPGLFSTRAPGKTVFRALDHFGRGLGRGTMTEPINDSKGCGGVMRAAPAALWSSEPTEVFELAARTAALTHGHPSGYLPAGALAVIVQQAVLGRGLDDGVWLALQVLETWEGHEETSTALAMAVDLAAYGVPTPEQLTESLGGGWVGEQALAVAVCATLVAGEDVELALRIAVHHSGDSDSTGAICGNIIGALVGIAGLPVAWLAELELRDVVEQMAMDCVAEFDRTDPASESEPQPPTDEEWNERYPVRSSRPTEAGGTATDSPTRLLPAVELESADEQETGQDPEQSGEASSSQLGSPQPQAPQPQAPSRSAQHFPPEEQHQHGRLSEEQPEQHPAADPPPEERAQDVQESPQPEPNPAQPEESGGQHDTDYELPAGESENPGERAMPAEVFASDAHQPKPAPRRINSVRTGQFTTGQAGTGQVATGEVSTGQAATEQVDTRQLATGHPGAEPENRQEETR